MSTKCPLGEGLYWKNGNSVHHGLPRMCIERCLGLWEDAASGPTFNIDNLPHDEEADCRDAGAEYEDESLQRFDAPNGDNRMYGILNTCTECGDEAFAEEYTFTCPND